MAKLILDKNEFTVNQLVDYMNKKYFEFGVRKTPFSARDVHNWGVDKKLPKLFGNQYVTVLKCENLKIIRLTNERPEDQSTQKVTILKDINNGGEETSGL